MSNYSTIIDPCEKCLTSAKELKNLHLSDRVAKDGFRTLYSHHYICPKCESVYVTYDDDCEKFGHQKRYKLEEEKRQKLLSRVPYKSWIPVTNPKTEYGVYKKRGILEMHNPFKGHVYHLIEIAFQENRQKDIEKLETVYPKEVDYVRNFVI